MTVKIIQTCDSCGTKRELKVSHKRGLETISESSVIDGWVTPDYATHICKGCIQSLIEMKGRKHNANS